MKQTVEQIFEILILNVLANLFRPEASIEYSIFSFVELGCHYNYSQLSEETRLRRDLLCVECDIKRPRSVFERHAVHAHVQVQPIAGLSVHYTYGDLQ